MLIPWVDSECWDADQCQFDPVCENYGSCIFVSCVESDELAEELERWFGDESTQ